MPLAEATALTSLTRLAARDPKHRRLLELALRGRLERLAPTVLDVAIETGDPIGSVLAELIERETSIEVVEAILAHFDQAKYRECVALQGAVLASTRRVLSHRQDASGTMREQSLSEVARLASNLGFSLSLVGQREDALKNSQKAVEAFRRISQPYELAASLINLGVAHSTLGQYELARQVTEEAVQISRELAMQRPAERSTILAQSLMNLGSIVFSLGLGEEALEATTEAVEILSRLIVGDLRPFRADLVRSLNNLGAILRSLGRFIEALEATSRSLELQQSLTDLEPDARFGDFASRLENLVRGLRERESRKGEALARLREVVEARRRVAASGTRSALLELVDGLEDLTVTSLEAGERGSASEAVMEAIEVLQQVEGQRPAETAGRLRALMDRLAAAVEESDLATDPTKRIASLERAVRSVTFFFSKQPLVFADPMNTALLTYLATVVRAGREPDRQLLKPIIQTIEKEILLGASGSL